MALIEKLTAIADSLRAKLGTEDTYALAEMPQKVEQVYEAGKQAQYQGFWDNVPAMTQKYLFAGPAWNVNTFFPDKSISFSGSLTDHMFALHGSGFEAYDLVQRLADCGVSLDFHGITRASYMFYNTNLTRLPYLDLSGCSKLSSTFAYSKKLHTIDGLCLAAGTVFDNAFSQCTALENITISGTIGQNGLDVADCPLSYKSLMSILNALQDGVSGKTVTLGEHNLAGLTEAEKAIATDKGWTLQ